MARYRKRKKLKLKPAERARIRMLLKSKRLSGRVFARVLVLHMLDQKEKPAVIAKWVQITPRTVTNIRQRYFQKGLDAALYEKARSGRKKVVTDKKTQKIIAIACTDAPDGYDRWTLSLLRDATIKKRLCVKLARKKSGSS